MGTKDLDRLYGALNDPAAVIQTPNTVSRNIKVGDRAFATTVQESGKVILDAELQLHQDSIWWENLLLKGWQIPSGWLRGQNRNGPHTNFIYTAPLGFDDSSGRIPVPIQPDGTLLNALIMPRVEAVVAGHPVVVEYTNTTTEGGNLILFEDPPSPADDPPVIKRTDFVFLEVWLALVAPSPRARGTVVINDSTKIVPGVDQVLIGGVPLTASLLPGPGLFVVVAGDNAATATNLAAAITATLPLVATGSSSGNVVTVVATPPGVAGNAITLATVVTEPLSITVSGPNLTGGIDYFNKPDQSTLYRHGNVLSPLMVALPDEFLDARLLSETSQRIQVQYRIRVTGATEAVNYKTHPDGFSSAGVLAQGAGPTPVVDYPFVPADRASIRNNSSAVAYGMADDGLWIAGDGSSTSAQALGTVDGYAYAIPLAFVFRHNDAGLSSPRGFDPAANANGALSYLHPDYLVFPYCATGPVPAGLSDRPDKEFCDVIGLSRVMDLRRHVVFPGVDLAGEVAFQIQSLLDGSLKTWSVDTADQQWLGDESGDVSPTFLICDEIGRTAAKEGADPISGDTKRGVCIRNFDHIARRFADQPVVERVVFSFYPGDRQVAPPVAPGLVNPGKYVVKNPLDPGIGDAWYEDDVLHLDLANLDATGQSCLFDGRDGGTSGVGLAGTSVVYFAPPGTTITDVLSAYHDDGHSVVPIDQQVQVKLIQGLGTSHLTVTLDANDQTANNGGVPAIDHPVIGYDIHQGSQRRIFLEVEITYPIGVGATHTPTGILVPDTTVYPATGDWGRGPGPKIESDPDPTTGIPTQRPGDFHVPLSPRFRDGFREIQLDYATNNSVSGVPSVNPVQDYIVSRDATSLVLPRRVSSDVDLEVYDSSAVQHVVDTSLSELGSSTRFISLNGDALAITQECCKVNYYPQDPIPNYGPLGGGYQVAVYYRANAPQTAGIMEGVLYIGGGGVMPITVRAEPLYVGSSVLTGQTGMGSVDTGNPYAAPLDQIPINDTTALGPPPVIREWYFCATADISVSDFDANTGLLALHPFIEIDVQNNIIFGDVAAEELPRSDAEFRAFYPMTDPDTYRPTISAQPLTGMVRHKVFVPILARAVEDALNPGSGSLLYRKNELLLLVLSRYAELDDDNTVRFVTDPAVNKACVALYRTRDLLLVVGDRTIEP